MTRLTILPIIAKSGIKVYTSHRIQKVENNKLTELDIKNNETKELHFDILVLAFVTKPVRYLEESLKTIESGLFTALKI